MATQAQIDANRRNAQLSSGPKTDDGKEVSRGNATKHGLAAELEPTRSPEFLDRRARWEPEYQPEGEAAHWAFDRLIAASFRIEKCERSLDTLIDHQAERAGLVWDQDRALEAATIAGRLAKDPVVASRQLQSSLAGVHLLMEWWMALAATLSEGRDWSDEEEERALDLLGIAVDFRAGPTPIDAPEGVDSIAFRQSLVRDEIEIMKTLRDESLRPLNELERRRAIRGEDGLSSKEAKLILRYERDAWKRYREAIRQIQEDHPEPTPTPTPAPVVPLPQPSIVTTPQSPVASQISQPTQFQTVATDLPTTRPHPTRLDGTNPIGSPVGFYQQGQILDGDAMRAEANGV